MLILPHDPDDAEESFVSGCPAYRGFKGSARYLVNSVVEARWE